MASAKAQERRSLGLADISRRTGAIQRSHADGLDSREVVADAVGNVYYVRYVRGVVVKGDKVLEHLRGDSAAVKALVEQTNANREVLTRYGFEGFEKRFGGKTRGAITLGMTPGVRKRMRQRCAWLLAGAMSWIMAGEDRSVWFLTFTHGATGGTSAAASRRQIEVLKKALARRCGDRFGAKLVREWQKRGAVHWHAILFLDRLDPSEIEDCIRGEWHRITGDEGSDPLDRRRECFDMRATDASQHLVGYLGSEFSKKAQQTVPEGEDTPGQASIEWNMPLLDSVAASATFERHKLGRSEAARQITQANSYRTDEVPYAQLHFFGQHAIDIMQATA